jgi:hypothetical protein
MKGASNYILLQQHYATAPSICLPDLTFLRKIHAISGLILKPL